MYEICRVQQVRIRVETRLFESNQFLPRDAMLAPKIGTTSLYVSTLLNINRFSEIFHRQNQE